MIRLIVRETNHALAAHVDGALVETSFRTFDVEIPELEAALSPRGDYIAAQLIGCEIFPALKESK